MTFIVKLAEYPALRAGMNAKRQLHENSRTAALEIFAIKRKLDFRMSLHTLHIVQGLSHQRERLFGKSDLNSIWGFDVSCGIGLPQMFYCKTRMLFWSYLNVH